MTYIIILVAIVLLYRFFQIVAVTKQPRITCKRHTWQAAIMFNPNDKDDAQQIMFCTTCGMMPSDDINNPNFLDKA